MLWTLFIVLLALWLLGVVVSSYTLGGFVHLLLVLAVLALIFQLLSDRHGVVLTTETKRSHMDKDRIKGKIKDVAGRVQRQTGEWTGSEEQQVKGTAGQVEGKVQNIAGRAKDAARDVMQDAEKDVRDEEQRPIAEEPRRKRTA